MVGTAHTMYIPCQVKTLWGRPGTAASFLKNVTRLSCADHKHAGYARCLLVWEPTLQVDTLTTPHIHIDEPVPPSFLHLWTFPTRSQMGKTFPTGFFTRARLRSSGRASSSFQYELNPLEWLSLSPPPPLPPTPFDSQQRDRRVLFFSDFSFL
jgi:hypothetical protein